MKPYSLFLIILAFWIGCVKTQIGEKPRDKAADALNEKESISVKESFIVVANSMVKGDPETTYKYLSAYEQQRQTLDEFKTEYEKNKLAWQSMFRGAFLKQVGIEDTSASAWVIWGNGDNGLITFIKEGGIWKIDDMRGPPPILMPSGG